MSPASAPAKAETARPAISGPNPSGASSSPGPLPPPVPPVFTFLGISVSPLTLEQLLACIAQAIARPQQAIIANHNLHSLYLLGRRPALREFYRRAALTHIDGMPLVWIGRLYGHPLRRAHRVTYVDLLPALLDEASRRGWRVFYLGSQPPVCQAAVQAVARLYPSLVLDHAHGYFNPERTSAQNRAVLAQIRSFAPQVLLVGMGMPRQEEWILANRAALPPSVILPCGAAMDYLAGAIPTPPRWAGRLGLEWLFRLVAEPRRLGSRYLVEPWHIAALLARDLLRTCRRAAQRPPPARKGAPRAAFAPEPAPERGPGGRPGKAPEAMGSRHHAAATQEQP